MRIIYGKSKWGAEALGLEAFLEKARAGGFGATEINLTEIEASPAECVALHRGLGLAQVAQLVIDGDTVDAQRRFLDTWFPRALLFEPIMINLHTGRDFFTFEENLGLFEHINGLGRDVGVSVVHETHRGRALYSAVETRRYLEACPELYLNADISHWMVVQESDLANQAETIALAGRRTRYIHARVGYEQGPQVTDPRAPEWAGHLENHLAFWRGVIEARRAAGDDFLVITPEYGPPAYMHTLPFTNQPVSDTWGVNVVMMEILRERLGRD